jgi:flagellar hook protein FlgE
MTMMQAMDSAISGLEAQQTMLDTTANNLANADTIGYKGQSTQFVDELAQTLQGATAPGAYNGGANAQQVGLGVQIGSIENEMSQGSIQTTGNALDIAIEGNGFLQVASGDVNPTGQTATGPVPINDESSAEYTQAGNLQVNSQGYLTTQSGDYVLGQGATADTTTTPPTYSASPTSDGVGAIKVPTTATNVAIGSDGAVTYTDNDPTSSTYGDTVTAGYIQLATFTNQAGLTRAGGSMWQASPSSGPAITNLPGDNGAGTLVSGELEDSNVDMATEFSNMIDAQNSYEADSKVITTGQSMLQSLVQMVS